MNFKRFSAIAIFWGLLFIILSGMGFRVFILPLFESDPIYKPIQINKQDKALMPVNLLISNLKNGHWHLINESFSTNELLIEFMVKFELSKNEEGKISGGMFDSKMIMFELKSANPQSKEKRPDFIVTIGLQSANETKETVSAEFRTEFDEIGKQYLITKANYTGKWDKGSSAGRTEDESFQIPQISESPCVIESDGGFTYIKLKNRKDENSNTEKAIVLGDSPNVEQENVPVNYFDTDAIQQAPFQGFTYTYENPKWTACHKVSPKVVCNKLFDRYKTETYYPGNLISNQDLIDNEQPKIFSRIKDATGTLFTSYGNQQVPFPIGFFLDNRLNRITALTYNNDIVHYGDREGQYHFDTPAALTVIGDYLYVLDKGEADRVIIFKHSLSTSGDFEFTLIGGANLGMNLQGVIDIAGFSTNEGNILYLFDSMDDAIVRLIIDEKTGLPESSETPIRLKTYRDYKGNIHRLTGVTKIESSPRNAKTGKNIIMAIGYDNQTLSFGTDGLSSESELQLNFKHTLPIGSGLINIGYNVGNNTFNIPDIYLGKLHVFSSLGNYLGSGGSFGTSEFNEELYRPNIVSSNNFADDALEMIVGSYWGTITGLKRIFPKADIGKIEVIEKSPVAMDQVEDNMMMFRYALTAGNDIDNIRLKLNGELIKETTEGFFPNVFSENFLVNENGENGIKGKLKNGWNTYEVELTARIPGPDNGNLQYKRAKSIQFYFMPSIVSDDTNFIIGNSSESDIPHNEDNPFYLYKNMLVEGEGLFSISGGKMILMKGCTLQIAKERVFYASNERFELMCGANIEINTSEDIPKVFKDTHFNGLDNYNMVSCKGDYTGGLGAGSAPSSMLEFISCNFESYLGKAIHLIEGRSTVANCSFNPGSGYKQATTVAIAVDPLARLDVRGGSFLNNDIAIDGNSADLFIGRSASSYKDTPISNVLFEDNYIGVHTFSGSTEIQHSNFTSNIIAFIDLNGFLDISKNCENTFEENVQGMVFSNVLIGESGKNKFINNNVDMTYLVPDGEITPVDIDVSCNYWKHDDVIGTAIINIISDPEYDPETALINFETNPFLEQIGNSGNYTCTGGKGKNGRYAPEEIVAMEPVQYHKDFSRIIDRLNGKADTYQDLAVQQVSIRLSDYSTNESLNISHQKAMLKNSVFAYLYRSYKTDRDINDNNFRSAYQLLEEGGTHYDHYVDITRDKLAFARLFLINKSKVDPPVFIAPDFDVNQYMILYPNPTDGIANISLNLPNNNTYTIDLYGNNGNKIETIVGNKFYEQQSHYSLEINLQHHKSGLYFVKLYSTDGQINQTLKLLKK